MREKIYKALDVTLCLIVAGSLMLSCLELKVYSIALVLGVSGVLVFYYYALPYWARKQWIVSWLEQHGGNSRKKDLFEAFQTRFTDEDGKDVQTTFESSLAWLSLFYQIRQPGEWVALYECADSEITGSPFILKKDGEESPVQTASHYPSWQPEPELLSPKPRRVTTDWQSWTLIVTFLITAPFFLVKVPSPVGLILFSIILVLGCLFGWHIQSKSRLLSIGDPVAGHVESVRISGSNKGMRIYATLSYSYQGKRFEVTTSTGQVSPQDVLTLLVDPGNPKHFVVYMNCNARVKIG